MPLFFVIQLHVFAADGIVDKLHVVSILQVVAYHDDVGNVIVKPVAMAVAPEPRPVVKSWRTRIPVDLVVVRVTVVGIVVGVMASAAAGNRSDARRTSFTNLAIG